MPKMCYVASERGTQKIGEAQAATDQPKGSGETYLFGSFGKLVWQRRLQQKDECYRRTSSTALQYNLYGV